MPLKQHLLSWDQRRTLRERLDALAGALRGPDLSPGPDAASAEHASELAHVLEALARVDSAEFGKCCTCGTPIAWARLLARPQSRRCLRCESALQGPSRSNP